MNSLIKFFYPGVRLKRWLFLFILSFFVFSTGFSGILGKGGAGINLPFVKLDRYINPVRDFILRSTKLVTIDIIVLILGALGIYFVVKGFTRHLSALNPQKVDIIKASYDEIKLQKGPKLVTLGGGTGLSSLLKGLKLFTSNITAVVTVADDGGSSGRLRKELRIPPPGDIRNCMVALADSSDLMGKMFQHRFHNRGKELEGHSLGNLFIGALTDITGSFELAVREAGNILTIRGRVVPVTLEKITLSAVLKNKKNINGQSRISNIGKPIDRVFMHPAHPLPSSESIEAIKKARLVVLGPGSLYTSVIPNLLVKNIALEIKRSRAKVVYVCNIMTQPGETRKYSAADHLEAISKHVGINIVDYVIVNSRPIPKELINKYRKKLSAPVKIDETRISKLGVKVVKADVFSVEKGLVRHDPEKLAKAIIRLTA